MEWSYSIKSIPREVLAFTHLRNTKGSLPKHQDSKEIQLPLLPQSSSLSCLLDEAKSHHSLPPFGCHFSALISHSFSNFHSPKSSQKALFSLQVSLPLSCSSNFSCSSSNLLTTFYPISNHHPHKPFKDHHFWSLRKQANTHTSSISKLSRREALSNLLHSTNSSRKFFLVVILTLLFMYFSRTRTPRLLIARWFWNLLQGLMTISCSMGFSFLVEKVVLKWDDVVWWLLCIMLYSCSKYCFGV